MARNHTYRYLYRGIFVESITHQSLQSEIQKEARNIKKTIRLVAELLYAPQGSHTKYQR